LVTHKQPIAAQPSLRGADAYEWSSNINAPRQSAYQAYVNKTEITMLSIARLQK